MSKKKYLVPLITSYYEYETVMAESAEDAEKLVRDGGGDPIEHMMEWRGVIDIMDDQILEMEE